MTDCYNVAIRKSAERELRSVPKRDLRRILQKIQSLTANPTQEGCIKLEGSATTARYRLRQGDWRILYEIDHSQKTVDVVKIGHRREVYR